MKVLLFSLQGENSPSDSLHYVGMVNAIQQRFTRATFFKQKEMNKYNMKT